MLNRTQKRIESDLISHKQEPLLGQCGGINYCSTFPQVLVPLTLAWQSETTNLLRWSFGFLELIARYTSTSCSKTGHPENRENISRISSTHLKSFTPAIRGTLHDKSLRSLRIFSGLAHTLIPRSYRSALALHKAHGMRGRSLLNWPLIDNLTIYVISKGVCPFWLNFEVKIYSP